MAALNNLALSSKAQGKYESALSLYRRALNILKETRGENHPDMAALLNNLALLYQAQGDYKEALLLYQRILQVEEKTLGKDHPSVATTLNNLALLYQTQGDTEAALLAYHGSLKIVEGRRWAKSIPMWRRYSIIWRDFMRYRATLNRRCRYTKGFANTRRCAGKKHPDVAALLNNLRDV